MSPATYLESSDYNIKFYSVVRYLFVDGQMYLLHYWDEDNQPMAIRKDELEADGGTFRRELDIVDAKTAIEYFQNHYDPAIRIRKTFFKKKPYLEFQQPGYDWKKIPSDARISYEITFNEIPVTTEYAAKMLPAKMFMEYMQERSK